MDKGPVVLISRQTVQRRAPAPRLELLIEREPGYRVFLGNLSDLLWSRRVPPLRLTSRPEPFLRDVFVPAGVRWPAFFESLLCHVLATILFVWGQSRVWLPEAPLLPHPRHSAVTYYPPAKSFPASGSRASAPARSLAKHGAAHQTAERQQAMRVTPQRKPALVTPPDIKQAAARLPDVLGGKSVTPMVPFAATAGAGRNAISGASGAVAPPPEAVDQATGRRVAVPQASVVAPAPEFEPTAGARAGKAPGAGGLRVVPSAPSLQNAGSSDRAGSLTGGPNVVPAPVQVGSAGAGLRSMGGAGSQAVPPPPSVGNAGNSGRSGRMNSSSGTGPSVVPPPPSVDNTAGDARLSAMGGAGSQAVPPAPSVRGKGAGEARAAVSSGAGAQAVGPPPAVQSAGGSRSGQSGSLSGTGSNVVPPPPSVQGGANGAGSGRSSVMASAGSPVAPTPSVEAAGGAGSARSGAGSGVGSEVMPPALSPGERAGNSSGGGLLQPMDPLPADAQASSGSAAGEDATKAIEEFPLGSIGLVFALPGTSFFSNYEVFVAKRLVGKNQQQLIKLVYEFLPYQRRLSEYNLNNLPARVIKLRVTPDPSCDESLGQMITTHADPNDPATGFLKLPDALSSADLTAVLPCYHINADDFRKAMSRGH